MVSFSCEICNDTVVKKKLNQHQQRCRGAYFTCIDCSTTFHGNDHNQHTSCISEAEKYEKGLYKGKGKQKAQKSTEKKPEPKVTRPEPKVKKAEVKKESKLAPHVNNKHQNLYKVLKKASKEDPKGLKKLLKNLTIANVDGKLVVE